MDAPSEGAPGPGAEAITSPDPRRGFLTKTLALTLGGLAYAVPAVAGVVAFLNPLRQKSQAGQFRRLASLDTLPEDGTPQEVSVIADRTDAWNTFANEPIGAVLLRRTGEERVEALNVVCPHAGCSVEYQPAAGRLFCPCHSASFDLSGKRLDANSPSPRDLDTLEVEIRSGTEVWVRFENFRTGTPQKTVEA